MAHPLHGEVKAVLVPALRNQVEHAVGAHDLPPRRGHRWSRCGRPCRPRILEERADAGHLLAGRCLHAYNCSRPRHCRISSGVKLTRKSKLKSLPWEETHGKSPAHPVSECLDFLQGARETASIVTSRGARWTHAVGVVGHEGAARASLLPARPQHEMLDDELAVSAKETGQSFLPVRGFKSIVLFNPHPGKLAELPREFVFPAGVLLFHFQEFDAL